MITRRQLLKKMGLVIAGLPFVPTLPKQSRVGYISLKTHPEYHSAKVFLNGVDISGDCFAADDVRGMVWCFAKNQNGNVIVDAVDPRGNAYEGQVWLPFGWTSCPRKEIRRGKVVIQLPNGVFID